MILQEFLNLNDTFLPKKLIKTRKIQLNFLTPKKPSKMPKNSAQLSLQKAQTQNAKFSSSKAKFHKLTLQNLRF